MNTLTSSFRASARRAPLISTRIPKASFRSSFRKYSTEAPPPKSSNTALYATIGLGYYAYSSSDTAATTAKSGVQATKAALKFTPTKADYQKVYDKIAQKIDDAGDYDDGSFGPVLLRLAWHSAGTFDKESKTGGSNYATMRFDSEASHNANNGLHIARALVEEVKKEFEVSHPQAGNGWPQDPWRSGRIDGFAKDATPDGRLPDASQAQDHLRSEIVALSGAHALGRCHTDRSGFEGPWTFSPTTVSNDYYKLLLNEKWVWRKWNGPKQYADKKTGTLMMLPTDYSLVQDKAFKNFSAVIAKLFELGVPEAQWATSEPWTFASSNEHESK
ncbi:heme peroxidase [Lactarius indigo]|nr:heme peroxidase [Lactarius indigo]